MEDFISLLSDIEYSCKQVNTVSFAARHGERNARPIRQGRRGRKRGAAYLTKSVEQVCAKAILSRRKGIQESDDGVGKRSFQRSLLAREPCRPKH